MVKQVAPPAWHPRKVSVPPPPWHPTSGSRTTGRLPKTLTRSWQPRVSCAISPRSNCPPPAWLPRSSPAPSRVLGVSVPTPLETAPPRLCRVLAGAAPVSRPLVCSPGVVKPCIPRCLKLHLLEQKKLKVFWAGEASAHLKEAQLVRKFGGSNKHLRVAFRGAASTLRRHRCGWSRFKEYCAFAGISPALADDHAFAEFASVFADGGDSADEPSDFAFAESGMAGLRSSLASLRWLANRLALVTWTSSSDSPVLKGYAYSAENREPKAGSPCLASLSVGAV